MIERQRHFPRGVARPTLSDLRVRTLSELATLDIHEAERYTRMLQIASVSIRPGRPMRGTLSHLAGDRIIIDAVAWTGTKQGDPARKILYPGASLPFQNSVQSLLHIGGTIAWDDVAATPEEVLATPKRVGARAMIGTALQIGQRKYFVIFSSSQPVEPPFSDDDIHYVQIVASLFSNTFKQRQHVEQLRYQMEHDALTGLENRVQFRKAIRTEIMRKQPFAIALVNLDRFGHLNEIHGQTICDEVLVEVAAALAAVEPHALAARLYGDEFGLLLRGAIVADVERTLERVLDPFHRPFHTGDRDGTRMLSVSASLGCMVYPNHGESAEELLRGASVALAIAKEQGGGGAVVFDAAMKVVVERRRFESSEIERAIAGDELRLDYQPTFDLRTGAIVGAEALIRWDHPERGEVQPLEFIPAAERNGLMGAVSRWVMHRAVRDVMRIPSPPPEFRIFFNLSAQNLDDLSFLEALTGTVTACTGLGDRLGVEITETIAMQNVERSLTTLGLIRSLGIRIAIDDFGTGYSSLSYLKRLPVDVIKIDRSFIAGLPGDEKDAVLADTMIGICKRLHIVSLAEGIETEEQRAWLTAHGCDHGQGFLVDRPLRFERLLERLGRAGVPR